MSRRDNSERDDLLRALVNADKSDREIADFFGKTRNAIIGWRHRLGIHRIRLIPDPRTGGSRWDIPQRLQRRETVELKEQTEPQSQEGAGVEPAERFSGPPALPPAASGTPESELIDLPALPRKTADLAAYGRDYRAKKRERNAAARAAAVAANPPTTAAKAPKSTIARPVAHPKPALDRDGRRDLRREQAKVAYDARDKPVTLAPVVPKSLSEKAAELFVDKAQERARAERQPPKPSVAAISLPEHQAGPPAVALINPVTDREDGKITIFELRIGRCHFPMWPDAGATPIEEKFYCGEWSGSETYCGDHANRMRASR